MLSKVKKAALGVAALSGTAVGGAAVAGAAISTLAPRRRRPPPRDGRRRGTCRPTDPPVTRTPREGGHRRSGGEGASGRGQGRRRRHGRRRDDGLLRQRLRGDRDEGGRQRGRDPPRQLVQRHGPPRRLGRWSTAARVPELRPRPDASPDAAGLASARRENAGVVDPLAPLRIDLRDGRRYHLPRCPPGERLSPGAQPKARRRGGGARGKTPNEG